MANPSLLLLNHVYLLTCNSLDLSSIWGHYWSPTGHPEGRGNSATSKGMINTSSASLTSISLTQVACPLTATPSMSIFSLRGIYIITGCLIFLWMQRPGFPGSSKHARYNVESCGSPAQSDASQNLNSDTWLSAAWSHTKLTGSLACTRHIWGLTPGTARWQGTKSLLLWHPVLQKLHPPTLETITKFGK